MSRYWYTACLPASSVAQVRRGLSVGRVDCGPTRRKMFLMTGTAACGRGAAEARSLRLAGLTGRCKGKNEPSRQPNAAGIFCLGPPIREERLLLQDYQPLLPHMQLQHTFQQPRHHTHSSHHSIRCKYQHTTTAVSVQAAAPLHLFPSTAIHSDASMSANAYNTRIHRRNGSCAVASCVQVALEYFYSPPLQCSSWPQTAQWVKSITLVRQGPLSFRSILILHGMAPRAAASSWLSGWSSSSRVLVQVLRLAVLDLVVLVSRLCQPVLPLPAAPGKGPRVAARFVLPSLFKDSWNTGFYSASKMTGAKHQHCMPELLTCSLTWILGQASTGYSASQSHPFPGFSLKLLGLWRGGQAQVVFRFVVCWWPTSAATVGLACSLPSSPESVLAGRSQPFPCVVQVAAGERVWAQTAQSFRL